MATVSATPATVNEQDPRFVFVADQLRSPGYVILTDFLPPPLLHLLHRQVKTADEAAFRRAGIGRDQGFQLNRAIRGDRILWVDESDSGLQPYFAWMESLRFHLNRELLLGLFDYECHYAYYPEKAFYKKHLDAFRGSSNRRLSSVLYLNPDWHPGDGGELVIYGEDGADVLETVVPAFGTLVLFLSEVFPHEVLPTRRPRYSLTGWFRVNDNSHALAPLR